MLISHAYISWRTYRALSRADVSKWLKMLPFLLLASFYLLPLSGLFYYLIWGEPDMLTFSQPVTYWFWFGIVFSAQLLSWLLVLDILKLVLRFFSKIKSDLFETWYRWLFLALAVGLFALTTIKMVRDTNRIQVKNHTYQSEKVPDAFDGFRIVHITDIQGDEFTGRQEIARYVNLINQQQPDMVVFTGDLISFGTNFIEMAAEELGRAESAYGTYAVVGDHDYWADVTNFESAYGKQGITLLQDENRLLTANDDSLLLTGITEVYSKHIPEDSLKYLTKGYPGVSFEILATHQATGKVISRTREANYELLLAGHTHGGQMKVPFLFMTFSAAEGDTPYLSGTYTFGDLLMNVDNGLGFTLAPVRYNAPPTISVIELKKARD